MCVLLPTAHQSAVSVAVLSGIPSISSGRIAYKQLYTVVITVILALQSQSHARTHAHTHAHTRTHTHTHTVSLLHDKTTIIQDIYISYKHKIHCAQLTKNVNN